MALGVSSRKSPGQPRLCDRSLVLEYNVPLRNRFDFLEHEVDLESTWENFKDSVSQFLMEVLGQRPRRSKEGHLSQKGFSGGTAGIQVEGP